MHPDRDEPELGSRLLGLAERRATELAHARGYGEPSLDVFCITANRAKRELLLRHGFALTRTMYRMGADLDEGVTPSPPPDGIVVRPFRPGDDDRVMHRTMTDAFGDYFRQSEEPFAAWRERLLGRPDFDAGLWFLAWDGDEPAGALIAYDYGQVGWIKGLGVRRPWRRGGVGGALLTHAFVELARRGQTRAELVVDAEGATRPLRLYEAVGMRMTSSYELYAKSLTAAG